jgi:hypothetical protein
MQRAQIGTESGRAKIVLLTDSNLAGAVDLSACCGTAEQEDLVDSLSKHDSALTDILRPLALDLSSFARAKGTERTGSQRSATRTGSDGLIFFNFFKEAFHKGRDQALQFLQNRDANEATLPCCLTNSVSVLGGPSGPYVAPVASGTARPGSKSE